MDYLKSLIDESLARFKDDIYADFRNLHLDVVRQLHAQQVFLEEVVVRNDETRLQLMGRIQQLQEENEQLRRQY